MKTNTLASPPACWRDGTAKEQAAFQGWMDAQRGREAALWAADAFGKDNASTYHAYFDASFEVYIKAKRENNNH